MAQIRSLVDRLRALWRVKNPRAVKSELEDVRPEDLADALTRVPREEALGILQDLDELQAANVLVELPTETARRLVRDLPDSLVAAYLDVLPMDDAMDLREDIGDDRFGALLEFIPAEDAREIRRLLAYPERSVGRLMTERFFEIAPDATMAQLLEDLRLASPDKYETVNDVYVLDGGRYLLGVFSLRKALRASPDTPAREVMTQDVIVAHATDEAEDAARRMARYGFYALPILDDRGRMIGLFTGDDAQTVLREAETKDVLAVGAVSGPAESYLSLSVAQLARRRFPWLLGLFVAETLTGLVMRHYAQEDADLGISPLMFFLPLLIGAGGNSGAQVTTTITRALALGEVGPRDWFLVLRREFVTALFVGTALGFAGYLRALGWGTDWQLSLVVGIALPAIVLWAATVGSLLPLAAKRLGIDPAVMSAPFITTFVDATGLIIYFEIARAIIG